MMMTDTPNVSYSHIEYSCQGRRSLRRRYVINLLGFVPKELKVNGPGNRSVNAH